MPLIWAAISAHGFGHAAQVVPALATVLAGLGVALVPSIAMVPAFAPPTPGFWFASLAIALVYGAAMGVDFPGSNRRFSRLAAAD